MTLPCVFVGYDSREHAAYRVCVNSMREHASVQPLIRPISAPLLGAGYRRPTARRERVLWDTISDQPMSTEFSIARFFVPAMATAGGWVLFCDCDFLWRADVNELFALADPKYAVMVVKHAHDSGVASKMDAQPQTYYWRKNWSSLVLLNCDAPECRELTQGVCNAATKHWLHGFFWVKDDARIGEIPVAWNWLAEVSPPVTEAGGPRAVHYTLGTPDMAGREHAPYANEWRRYAGR